MANYANSINGVALSTTADLRTIVTTASGAGSGVALKEIYLSGEAGSSSYGRVVVNRPSVVGVTITAGTWDKCHPASVAAASSVATNWTGSQPTLSSTDVLGPGLNAFAGQVHWYALPGCEIVVGLQGAVANLSIRSRSGTPTVSGHILMEEY
jgi:hypothetical protein